MSFDTIRAVAFDAVGTLIEPWPTVSQAYRMAAAELGVEVSDDVVRGRFGMAFSRDESIGGYRTDEANERERWRRIVGDCLPELSRSQADEAFERLWEHFATPENWRLFTDVEPVITRLAQAGLKLCIASNFDGRLRQVWAGLADPDLPLRTFVISSEVGARKPGGPFYDAVLSSLGHPASETLFVGDDPANDFRVPRELGFHAVLIDRRRRVELPDSIERLTDLLAMFDSAEGIRHR